ncbi:MAG: MFS transporter, partial [Planctomycetota bacterium]|nr:MFS transporter [Planctomycetota bacterium]
MRAVQPTAEGGCPTCANEHKRWHGMNELDIDHDDEQQIDTVYLYLVALVAAVGGFLFGYDLSLISGAILFLKTEFSLTPFWFGFVTGSAVLGCPFGPLAGVWLADTFGRKRTLIVASILFLDSALGSAVSPDMLQLSVWRFIGGMGVGLASTVSPMYIAEIAPA